jgi:hypothetical protein
MEHWAFGRRLSNCDILDIGPGQVPVQLIYFNPSALMSTKSSSAALLWRC